MENMNRLQYDNWPRWIKIVHACTFPVSEPAIMLLMMLGTITAALVLMALLLGYGGVFLMIFITDWAGWKT